MTNVVVLSDGRCIRIGALVSLEAIEQAHIQGVLARMGPSRAAKVLGIERSTLLAKRKKYGLGTPIIRLTRRA